MHHHGSNFWAHVKDSGHAHSAFVYRLLTHKAGFLPCFSTVSSTAWTPLEEYLGGHFFVFLTAYHFNEYFEKYLEKMIIGDKYNEKEIPAELPSMRQISLQKRDVCCHSALIA